MSLAATESHSDYYQQSQSSSGQNWTLVKKRLRIISIANGQQTHGYSEFSGFGAPPITLGSSGDIYLDLSPASINVYGRYPEAWKLWPGPQSKQNMLLHPALSNRCLWCSESIGWQAHNRITLRPDKAPDVVIANSSTYKEHLKYVRKRQNLDANEPNSKKAKTSNSTYQSQASASSFHYSTNSQQLGPGMSSVPRYDATTGQYANFSVRESAVQGPHTSPDSYDRMRRPIEEPNGTRTGESHGNSLLDSNRLKDVANSALYELGIAQQKIGRLEQENNFLRTRLTQLSGNGMTRNPHEPQAESVVPSLPHGTGPPSQLLYYKSQTRKANNEEHQNELSNDTSLTSASSADAPGTSIPVDSAPVQTPGSHSVKLAPGHPRSPCRSSDTLPTDSHTTTRSQALVYDKKAVDLQLPPSSVRSPHNHWHQFEVTSETEGASTGVGIKAPSQLKSKQAHMSIFFREAADSVTCRLCRVQGTSIFEVTLDKQDSTHSMEKHLFDEHPIEFEAICDLTDDALLELQTAML